MRIYEDEISYYHQKQRTRNLNAIIDCISKWNHLKNLDYDARNNFNGTHTRCILKLKELRNLNIKYINGFTEENVIEIVTGLLRLKKLTLTDYRSISFAISMYNEIEGICRLREAKLIIEICNNNLEVLLKNI